MYNRHVFYHPLGGDPAKDPVIFGEGRDPEDWPNVAMSNDGRWLSIMVEQGWSKNEVFLKDLRSGSAPQRITTGKDFLYFAQAYNADLYILTNEGGARYHVFKAPLAKATRERWREIIPQSDAVLTSLHIIGGQLFARYELNAHSRLRRFNTDGKPLGEIELPTLGTITAIGGEFDSTSAFYLFSSFIMPPTIYRFDIPAQSTALWDSVTASASTPGTTRPGKSGTRRKMAPASRCSWSCAKAEADGPQPCTLSRATAALISA